MLAKSKLNSIEVLISKVLIYSVITQLFVVINHVLKKYNEMKAEIKKLRLNCSLDIACVAHVAKVSDLKVFGRMCQVY